MRALVWTAPEAMEVAEVAEPSAPGPGELLVEPSAVGICGSEVEGWHGGQAIRTPPLVMGHEFAGTVVGAAGPGWEGAAVAVNPLVSCGTCALCRAGLENACPTRELIGAHRPGAMADLVLVPEANARALPAGTDPRLGALAEPLANGIHVVGLGLASLPEPPQTCIVLGAGTIGLMAVQAALLAGVPWVASVEPSDGRRATAVDVVGAHAGFAAAEEAAEAARERTGGLGADLAVDAVGLSATRVAGVEAVRPGGSVACIGLADDDTALPFATHVVRRQVAVLGSYAYTMAEFEAALDALVGGETSLGALRETEPLDAGVEHFERLARGPAPAEFKVFLAGTGR